MAKAGESEGKYHRDRGMNWRKWNFRGLLSVTASNLCISAAWSSSYHLMRQTGHTFPGRSDARVAPRLYSPPGLPP